MAQAEVQSSSAGADGLAAYPAHLAQAYAQAAAQVGTTQAWLRVDDVVIALHLVGQATAAAVLPALGHLLLSAPDAAPQINLYVWDGTAPTSQPPRPPFGAADYRRYGQRAVAHGESVSVMHALGNAQVFAYDRAARRGYWWMRDAASLSIYERAAPAQTLFHWALQEFGWQIVHAAAVGNAAGGVLLVGNSGAGKSTTALSCLTLAGLRFLCDDKCLVRLTPEPEAFALFSSAKIKGDMLARLPDLRPLLAGWDDTYKADKGLVFLHPTYAARLVTRFPVAALVLPQVAHAAVAHCQPAAAGDVFRQLGPSTVIWLPGAEAENYRFNAAMTRRLPGFRLALATEPAANVAALRRLIEEIGGAA